MRHGATGNADAESQGFRRPWAPHAEREGYFSYQFPPMPIVGPWKTAFERALTTAGPLVSNKFCVWMLSEATATPVRNRAWEPMRATIQGVHCRLAVKFRSSRPEVRLRVSAVSWGTAPPPPVFVM